MHHKCLVIGGTGFLGMNLCSALVQAGHEVTVYGHASSHTERLQQYLPMVHLITSDFVSEKDFSAYLKDVDVVFHLVSTTRPSNKDVMMEFTTNVLPTIRLLDACAKEQVRLIYFSSGGTVYGVPRYVPIDEGHRTEPISAYGIHKLAEEKCIEYYGRTYGLDYCILRLANPYGAWQAPYGSQGVIAIFLAKALHNEEIEIWGDGSNVRDYIYVDDLMRAVCQILDYSGPERVFNIGSGRGYSLQEILYRIQKVTGKMLHVKHMPGRIQDVPANVLDTTLIQQETGWSPTTKLLDGLGLMHDMWNEEFQSYYPRKDK